MAVKKPNNRKYKHKAKVSTEELVDGLMFLLGRAPKPKAAVIREIKKMNVIVV